MTIKDKIDQTLRSLQTADPELFLLCFKLNNSINEIIVDVKDHLSTISQQMPDYDKHDATHSEKVLDNIQLLLRDEGINNLTLLEAMLLQLCCYLHDTGMALPNFATSLLTEVEQKEYSYHQESPIRTITAELQSVPGKLLKPYDRVNNQFFCPDSEEKYLTFLAQEIYDYEQYRMGLLEPDKTVTWEAFCKTTRQGYLRTTHGQRSKKYADNMDRLLDGLRGYDARTLANSAGNICRAHCVDISEVRELPSKVRICRGNCSESHMTYNERYLAMLLRLGDVIHFSEDRVSRTLYAEHTPMDHESDIHWQVKFSDLTYSIESREGKLEILYFGGFNEPDKYYFLQDHFDWVDDELHYYAAFVQAMEQEQQEQAARYRLGLPTNVIRSHVQPIGFSPDNSLKFRLEQQKVIELLMGLRLYRDEFMCLRELYQNALDACRCMRAENFKHGLTGDIPIEFGLDEDCGGVYIYCKDEGIGMTQDVVKNFLLRVGNSYYQSAEFRRANMGWGNVVAPVSEFGIGLLSCYMIADRIEIVTRHFRSAEKPIWICMEGTEDYGYYRNTSVSVDEWLGNHGTIVKIYLKQDYVSKVTEYLPQNATDEIFELEIITPNRKKSLPPETLTRLNAFANSLYHRVQQFIHIPEQGIPVYVCCNKNKLPIITVNDPYDLSQKIIPLTEHGFSVSDLEMDVVIRSETENHIWINHNVYSENDPRLPGILSAWFQKFTPYKCTIHDEAFDADACVILHLPNCADVNFDYLAPKWDRPIVSLQNGVYIDGMPVTWEYEEDYDIIDKGIRYHFNGMVRPKLTVDRSSVRDTPKEVLRLKQTLRNRMVEQVSVQIREHFNVFPHAISEKSQNYIFNYLKKKFDANFCVEVLDNLSVDLLKNYNLYGATLNDWFYKQPLTVSPSCLSQYRDIAFSLTASILYGASQVQIIDNQITIQRELPIQINPLFDGYWQDICVFRADSWPLEYSQYDAVSRFPNMIPQHVFTMLPNSRQSSDHCKFINRKHDRISLPEIARIDPVELKEMNLADVILLLEESKTHPRLHTMPAMDDLDTNTRKYVQFCYVNPRPLSRYDEERLQQYNHIPEYRQGVEKGWSILLYRYKDGYTISPGIIDRAEMIKRLPKEALEHNDGIEYYFTDGTKAF